MITLAMQFIMTKIELHELLVLINMSVRIYHRRRSRSQHESGIFSGIVAVQKFTSLALL